MAAAANVHDAENVKRQGVVCSSTRDGRVAVSVSASATVSRSKIAFCVVVAALVAGYGVAPLVGMQGMRSRVLQLEGQMARKLEWVLRHREHLQAHLGVGRLAEGDGDEGTASSGGGGTSNAGGRNSSISAGLSGWRAEDAARPPPPVPAGEVYPSDGRRHLLVPAGGVSRLAEALAPDTAVPEFDSHYLCGDTEVGEGEVVRKTVALAAVSWAAPLSLRNSMESWRTGGLLDVVDERMLFLNSPTAEDRAIAADFDFDVYTTEEHGGNIMAGPALGYLVGNSSADYILFMEKDFVLSADVATMKREMYTAVAHLARGVEVYRLRGKTDHPAEGMPDCCTPAEPPTCPFHSNWRSAGGFGDHMNWLLIFCDPDIMAHSNGRLIRCTREPAAPDSYCFTSGETNWSNNPVLFPRAWFMDRMREVAFKDWERNNMFEFLAMMEWLSWSPPARVCVSWNGIFTHREIDQ